MDTTFASPSATRPVSGATPTNNMKCVSNKIVNIIAYALHIVLQCTPVYRSCSGWTRKRSIHSNYSRLPATATLQEIEVNQTDKQEFQMVLMKLALESIGDARNMLL